jgi:hypothetical protein
MSNINTGGPAFPTSDWDENGRAYKIHGMTLRDYFAVKAMQALIDNDGLFSEIPTQAYVLADVMLKARQA